MVKKIQKWYVVRPPNARASAVPPIIDRERIFARTGAKIAPISWTRSGIDCMRVLGQPSKWFELFEQIGKEWEWLSLLL